MTNISYDPDRSDPKSLQILSTPTQPEAEVNFEKNSSFSQEEIQETTLSLQKEKEKLVENLFSNQAALKKTEKEYQDALHQNRTILKMISTGQSEGLNFCQQVVGNMMKILDCPSPTLTLVNAPIPNNITEEVSIHSINVCSLALLVAETLGLSHEEKQALGQGALLHNIGLHRIPSVIRRKQKEALKTKERSMLEIYPYYGREMVESLPGISPDCLDIITQHQENLDGSGYPRGLKGKEIAFLPRIIRVITEYNAFLNCGHISGRLIPTEALVYLFTKNEV